MKLTDPHELIGAIDPIQWSEMKRTSQPREDDEALNGPDYVEPSGFPRILEPNDETMSQEPNRRHACNSSAARSNAEFLRGKIQLLGDFIDTDAVSFRQLRDKSYYFLTRIT